MKFTDTIAKAAAYDAHNAQTAQQVQKEWAQDKVAKQQAAQKAAIIQKENELGLAYKVGAQHAVNSLLNTPRDMQGYQMPAAQPKSITGQDPRFNQMLMREALAKQSNGGLANTLATQNQYQGVR